MLNKEIRKISELNSFLNPPRLPPLVTCTDVEPDPAVPLAVVPPPPPVVVVVAVALDVDADRGVATAAVARRSADVDPDAVVAGRVEEVGDESEEPELQPVKDRMMRVY